jgi:GT2 family glycosyltransferase
MSPRLPQKHGDLPVTVSVVIPVHNAAGHLEACLAALRRSDSPASECIVIDDGSTDGSRKVAERHGAQIISLAGNRGPAWARNRGAEAATSDFLFFIDADVYVHPETIGAVAAALARHGDFAALIGSYDDQPADPLFLSQYRNLFHHYVHQHGKEEAATFWTGCGAVRRAAFLEIGGFNQQWPKGCVEDIELGFRLRQAGYRIRLEKEIQVTHGKRWRLLDLLRTDLFVRGVPWVALMLRDRRTVCDLNLSWPSRISTLLTYLLVLTLAALAGTGHARGTLPVLGGIGLGVISALLHDRVARVIWRKIPVPGLALLMPALWATCLSEPLSLAPLGILLALLGIQQEFYRFFARARGLSFAITVIPFHLLYFLCCGLAVPLGIIAYARGLAPGQTSGAGAENTPPQAVSAMERRCSGGQSGEWQPTGNSVEPP